MLTKVNPDSRGKTTVVVHEQIPHDERVELMEQIAADVIESHRLADEKKAVSSEYTSKIKALNARINENSVLIRVNSREVEIQVDLIPNWTTGMMEYMDEAGFVHRSRPMTAEERQHTADEVPGFTKDAANS